MSLYSKFLMTTKNPNDAGTKYLKIDYRPVSILLEKGSFMDVLSMPSSPAAKNIQERVEKFTKTYRTSCEGSNLVGG